MATAVAMTSLNPTVVATHHIWGKIESDSSCSASIDQSCEALDPERPQRRQRRSRSLPADVQQHLRDVVFHDESRSSEFHSTSDESAEGHLPACHAAPSLQGPGEVGEPPTVNENGEGGGETKGDETRTAEPWSNGSRLHDSGKCKPCHYVHTKLGCLNGQECNFCHIPHTKKSRPRPCKTKRMQCKRIVSMLEAASAKDPEQFAEATRVLSSQSTYLRSVLMNKLGGGEKEDEDGAKATNAGLVAEGEGAAMVDTGDDGAGAGDTGGAAAAAAAASAAGDSGVSAFAVAAAKAPNPSREGTPAVVSALLNKLKGEQAASRSTAPAKAKAKASK